MKATKKLFLLATTSLTLFSCTQLFEKKVGFDSSYKNAYLSSFLLPEEKIEKLEAPKQIFVSQFEFSNQIMITWSEVTGATSYRIEKAISTQKDIYGNFIAPDESEYAVIPLAEKIYGTQYTDLILKSPKYTDEEYNYRYFYRVSAENTRLKYEASDFIYSKAASLLPPPSNVVASRGEFMDKIIIKWDKVYGAVFYDIYRSSNTDGSSSINIGSVSANQNYFSNPTSSSDQGKEFYYTVVAKTSYNQSIASGLALGYSLQEGAPPKISNVAVSNGRGDSNKSISIKWDKAAGSNILYAIYRSSSVDSSFTLLAQNLSMEKTSYEDSKGLKDNIYYYYQVQAYKIEGEGADSKKIKGPFSDSGKDSDTPAEGFILSDPMDINVYRRREDTSKCQINFAAPIGSERFLDDSKLYSTYNDYVYKVYGSDSQDETSFVELATFAKDQISHNSDGYLIIPSVDYKKFYKLSTSFNGNESNKNNLAAPSPFAALNLKVTRASFIANYTDNDSKANAQGVFPVKLEWQPPLEDDADGGYNIYRSTNKDSGFKKINEAPIDKSVHYYIDANETAKAGTQYYYKVLTLNVLSQGANYSNAEFGYGALTAIQYMREYNKTVINSQKKLKLMHKPNDMDKLGSESVNGNISGGLSYKASVAGLGARILMHYQDYADFYINNNPQDGFYFIITGDTNTSASMDASGTMDGTVVCKGMYPGKVVYNNIQIKGGGAAGGTYGIVRDGFTGQQEISWTVGEEGK